MRFFLANSAIAFAVLTGSFWSASAFLHYLDHPGRNEADRGPVVFAMSVNRENLNWQEATPETTLAILGHQIAITSRAALGHYEVILGPFATKPQTRYAISYEVSLTKGGLEIGVQSLSQMIRTKRVITARDILTFTAISDTTQIELINTSRFPTAATLRDLVVMEIK
jgi:predicted DNA-binding transcriptional regulator AlpA